MLHFLWSRLWLVNLTFALLTLSPFILASDRLPTAENVIKTDSHLAGSERQVFVSTLNGELLAMDPRTGQIKWMLKEEPVLRVPVTVQHGYTFLPDPQDGSLYLLAEGRLKKMPFTIPQLVQASPCKSSDGVLYAGSKKDVWFGINPATGNKVETLSEATAERVCPASTEKAVFIGRTEYQISMFDALSRSKRYNATFTDYSSHVLPEDVTYPLQHFSSSSDGRIITVDGSTGRILWDRDFGNPIVAMYLLQGDGLHRLPFTVIGRETLDSLVESASAAKGRDWVDDFLHAQSKSTDQPKSLYPTLYVGETENGLYALPAFVDERTITIAPKYLGPPLIEGPTAIAGQAAGAPYNAPSERPLIRINANMPTITHRTVDGEFLLLGYHETPAVVRSDLIPMRTHGSWTPSFPHIAFVPPAEQGIHGQERPSRSTNGSGANDDDWTLDVILRQLWNRYPGYFSGAIVGVLTLFTLVVWMCGRQSATSSLAEPRSAQTSKRGMRSFWPLNEEEVPEGWMPVGKILYDPHFVLGRGCEGTIVYKGRFDGREVAVKRVVSDFMRLADREVDLLRESDTHPHVIRYFCMESDSQFRYIALELCCSTLQDFIEKESIRDRCPLSAIDILNQAAIGLSHLHSLKIVHRDIKPQNVLLSVPNQKGEVRALISDFGLCKRLQLGRNSVSRRSGVAGTDGWIAPEALQDETSVTCASDLFSLGCVFYYVMANGSHPFGDSLRRQANILQGEYSLKELNASTNAIGVALIEAMLSKEPLLRPTAEAVRMHPFFWSKDRQLQFFSDVSDRVEKEEEVSPVVRRLERNNRGIVTQNWRQVICPALAEDLRKFRTYKGNSVRDLLRAMRNKKHHYRELPQNVRDSLGSIPEQFVTYFTERFPQLLLHTYEAMKLCAAEAVFRSYYPDEVRNQAVDADLLVAAPTPPSPQEWVRGLAVQ